MTQYATSSPVKVGRVLPTNNSQILHFYGHFIFIRKEKVILDLYFLFRIYRKLLEGALLRLGLGFPSLGDFYSSHVYLPPRSDSMDNGTL